MCSGCESGMLSACIRHGDARGTHEYELRARGHPHVGAAVAAEKQESGPAIGHRQVDERAAIGRDRLHRDVKEFSDRLVDVLQPEERPCLAGALLQAKLGGAVIDLRKRWALASETKVG